jgi:formylmethanofuran dehydrogenase subunit E
MLPHIETKVPIDPRNILKCSKCNSMFFNSTAVETGKCIYCSTDAERLKVEEELKHHYFNIEYPTVSC